MLFLMWWLGYALTVVVTAHVNRPHIILFITDNLRWNGVSFHGSDHTPNINALANTGLTLENHYASPICSPSRSALMNGKYPAHTGDHDSKPDGLPREEKLLPQHLKDLGYAAHLIGKWRLGSVMREPSSPVVSEEAGVFDHMNIDKELWDADYNREHEKDGDVVEKYATDVYTAEAIKRIKNHDQSKPMFLMVANSAMQSGDSAQIIDSQRQKYDAMLSELDRAMGEVFSALQESEMLNNSIILFSTDNAVSGYPAGDNTLWEGGVRGSAALWSPLIEIKGSVATQRIHIADWLPTLISAAGGDISVLGNIDGTDQWDALSSASINDDHRDLHKGAKYNGNWNSWYGPSGQGDSYNVNLRIDSRIGRIVKDLDHSGTKDERKIANMKHNDTSRRVECEAFISPCLLNTEDRIVLNAGIWLSGGQKY